MAKILAKTDVEALEASKGQDRGIIAVRVMHTITADTDEIIPLPNFARNRVLVVAVDSITPSTGGLNVMLIPYLAGVQIVNAMRSVATLTAGQGMAFSVQGWADQVMLRLSLVDGATSVEYSAYLFVESAD